MPVIENGRTDRAQAIDAHRHAARCQREMLIGLVSAAPGAPPPLDVPVCAVEGDTPVSVVLDAPPSLVASVCRVDGDPVAEPKSKEMTAVTSVPTGLASAFRSRRQGSTD
jgi:hypothetical protein